MANVKIEIDGQSLEVPSSFTIMDAANQLGVHIPHFCYHKKLSIAANCRMCLVQVEKAPKPLPACATPVGEGMKVQTHSAAAVAAQKGVMEFLLINHPLDCPICDQGGECQLQDLAVGYGGSASRYAETKRVVPRKDIGPLVAAEEMSRCIHCTRCVRFGEEIAGMMELGMAGRGEHAEILSFVGRAVESELSGNMIDVCPVGALTSKPFRYAARTWELTRRKSVSPHCGLGSNLVVQIKQDKVVRVLPLENPDLNECWLSDKDRFSYEALNSGERLLRPMVKEHGRWVEVDWPVALERVARGLKEVLATHGASSVGALGSPHATLEELYLLRRLMQGAGSHNADFRLRQADFSADSARAGAPWLGMKVAELGGLDRVLVIGSNLRKDHPLIAQRLRQLTKKVGEVLLIDATDDDQRLRITHKLIRAPSRFAVALAEVVSAAALIKSVPVSAPLRAVVESAGASDEAKRIAESLCKAAHGAVFLGNRAQHHAQAGLLHRLALELARICGLKMGFLGAAANSVGGYVAGALPGTEGRNAAQMLANPLKAYFILHAEPELDCANGAQAMKAMQAAKFVVALSPFRHRATEYADVMLPVAPFTETAGSFINTEGRLQSFNGVARTLGESRPSWKVFRVLGNLLGLSGFDFNSAEEVRKTCLQGIDMAAMLNNNLIDASPLPVLAQASTGLERIAEVRIYDADGIVRRAPSLQRTGDAAAPSASMNAATLHKLGLREGQDVRVKQGAGEALLPLVRDDRLPDNCVRVPSATAVTAALGEGEIILEAVAQRKEVAA
ncbi:MAG: NADH-quinone oxidoreductase subunit G [Betaproteobacteria bacterium]|nr:NADH-quinone oxidoreductase subunit G [Betaproteobacteria bacterium]